VCVIALNKLMTMADVQAENCVVGERANRNSIPVSLQEGLLSVDLTSSYVNNIYYYTLYICRKNGCNNRMKVFTECEKH
jgi:hypothetical protein